MTDEGEKADLGLRLDHLVEGREHLLLHLGLGALEHGNAVHTAGHDACLS